MVFSSPIFLFWFLPLVLFSYYIVAKQNRNYVLLFFSILFYGWGEGRMLTVMLLSTLIIYFIGLRLEVTHNQSQKKRTLFVGIFAILTLLIYCKYSNFFIDNYNFAASSLGFSPIIWDTVILPLGISFYTLHGMSYIIDVYRGHTSPQKNPFKLTLYISFFPQLIAGPIIRYKDVEKQIDDRKIDVELFVSGIKRFIIGLSKKVLIANMLGRITEFVFNMPINELNGYWSWIALVAIGVQLYFDFSGYSDMAIGMGRMFGFRFLENFNYPLISQSMKEFWTRWHISLSSWFRDYIYYPLGGNRKGKLRMHLNLWTIFLLNGMWHGASWSFFIFGCYHGFLLTFERLGFSNILKWLPRPFRSIYVFFAYAIGDILFSIDNYHHAFSFYHSLFKFQTPDPYNRIHLYLTNEWYFIFFVGIILSIPIVEFFFSKIKNGNSKNVIEAIVLIVLFILTASELANSAYNPFLYFRI